jgi:hypothetical protein
MRELKAILDYQQHRHQQQQCCYILKPSKGSQGKGIELCFGRTAVHDAAQNMARNGPCIAQRYLPAPLTLRGMKWDARIYCVLTSVGPLKAWMYTDGLARFCTVPYQPPGPDNVESDFMHLTNYSLNCESKTYDPVLSKRCLSAVLEEMESNGDMRTEEFWSQASDLVAAAMVAYHPVLLAKYRGVFPSPDERCRCFHILGLDILLSSDMKLHLLEVNCNPSLNLMKAGSRVVKSEVDVKVKTGLLHGALKLINRERLGETVSEAEATVLQYRRVACGGEGRGRGDDGKESSGCSGAGNDSGDTGIRGGRALEAAALYFVKHRNRFSRRKDGEHTISRDFLQTQLQKSFATATSACRQEVSQIFRKLCQDLSLVAFLDLLVKLGRVVECCSDLETQVLQLLEIM